MIVAIIVGSYFLIGTLTGLAYMKFSKNDDVWDAQGKQEVPFPVFLVIWPIVWFIAAMEIVPSVYRWMKRRWRERFPLKPVTQMGHFRSWLRRTPEVPWNKK